MVEGWSTININFLLFIGVQSFPVSSVKTVVGSGWVITWISLRWPMKPGFTNDATGKLLAFCHHFMLRQATMMSCEVFLFIYLLMHYNRLSCSKLRRYHSCAHEEAKTNNRFEPKPFIVISCLKSLKYRIKAIANKWMYYGKNNQVQLQPGVVDLEL